MSVVPGAVDTETDVRVTVVRLPEILVVKVKLCVTVPVVPGSEVVTVLAGIVLTTVRVSVCVLAGSVVVIVCVKLSMLVTVVGTDVV